MRSIATFAVILCAVLSQQCRADDPAPPAQPSAAPAQPTAAPATAAAPAAAAAPSAEKGVAAATEQKAATTATAAATTISPGVTVVAAKAELTPEEKDLINRGYKLEVRNGEKYFCHKEQALGSRFERKYCDTAQSLVAHRADSQEAVRTIQNDRSLVNH